MPAPRARKSVRSALGGVLGLSAVAGVLVTAMVAPALAVTGVTATTTVGIFNDLPDYIVLDPGSQQNTIAVRNHAQPDASAPDAYLDVATIYRQNRQEVTLDQMSDHLECAAIAGEDRRFFDHRGVDIPSVVRAAVGQFTGSSDSGASTITMQLVRNIWQQQALNDPALTPEQKDAAITASMEQSIDRKLREMRLAISLEKAHSKDEILQAYLNIANFGGNTYGVQAAAFEYFGADSADLTVAQAAALIAIVQRPGARNLGDPANFSRNQDRRDVILREMAGYGCITAAERDEALAIAVDESFVDLHEPVVGCRNAAPNYGFVCDYAQRVVTELDSLGATPAERQAAWDRGGYRLILTIDHRVQDVAAGTVLQVAPADEARFELGAAATSVEVGTGRVITMAQNKTFDDDPRVTAADSTRSAVNYAADFRHGGGQGFQPGSTYKPYVLLAYLAAGGGLHENFDAGILNVDQARFADTCGPATLGDGSPRLDADGRPVSAPWGGTYTFRNDSGERGAYTGVTGTAQSVNSVFIQMAQAVDQCDIARMAASLGVHNGDNSSLVTRPSCSIGGCENAIAPLQQAAAYAAIANHGVYCEPVMIDAVQVVASGELLPGQPQRCTQSLASPGVADTAAHAMAAVMRGTGGASRPRDGVPYIGKTGTTDRSVHTWMVGSSTEVATAVWVGNVRGTQAMRAIRVNGLSGGVLRHAIFRPIAESINAVYGGGAFAGPDPTLLAGVQSTVPPVAGGTLEQARAALETAELLFADGGAVDSDLPVGTVVGTDPAAGSTVPRRTTVTVFTSNGLASPVPNVVGASLAAATAQLQAAGYTVADVCVDDGDLGGTPPPSPTAVTSQDPGAAR